MSKQPPRFAVIEIVSAAVDGYDGVPKSQQPHFLRLRSSNGQVLATSEIYSTVTNARRAVHAWLKAFLQVGFAEANGRELAHEVTP